AIRKASPLKNPPSMISTSTIMSSIQTGTILSRPKPIHSGYFVSWPKTRPGLVGEVAAGLVTQSYTMVGEEGWSIPIFLFRYHADVEAYIFDLVRDPARQRQVFGRFGNDVIAIALDEGKNVTRFMAGEAKWRQTITPSEMDT